MPPSDTAAPLTPPQPATAAGPLQAALKAGPQWWVILAISLSHFINDVMQSLLSAIYPLLQVEFDLSYAKIGYMTLAFMGTASLLQPLVGLVTDKRPIPLSLPIGMGSTLIGLIFLGFGTSYGWLLAGATLVGIGSAIFHPEASRVARAAAGGKFGTAQSLFQLGGNAGHAIGPLLAAFIVVPLGRLAVAAFALLALIGITMLTAVGRWHETVRRSAVAKGVPAAPLAQVSKQRIGFTLAVLALLVFSKNAYTASMSSYFTFYLMESFALSTQAAQISLFLYLFAGAAGVIVGGVVGDRIGTRRVIWFSILGCLPFTLLMPHVGLVAGIFCSVATGFIMASAFPAIVVYAQELVPGRVGMIAGLFFGFAFGTGGLVAAALGTVADARGIDYVFLLTSFLPVLGLLTIFLPRLTRAG